MSDKFVSERNLKFMLYEVFDAEGLTKHEYFQEHDREIFDMVLEAALKLGRDLLRPYLVAMDKEPPEYVDGQVKVHPIVKTMMREYGEGGWVAPTAPIDLGGQQLPLTLSSTCRFIFAAANYSASVYPFLTAGAAHLIEAFGSQELVDAYIPNMFEGRWQGTMALTEPQAGSSLSDIITRAEPTDNGYYLINGQKIFISAGDHDGVENVIHLMLAKIKGAPAGVKGISLFVVPKMRIKENGELEPNDLNVAGIYHKLGYKGAPITQLSMGENNDCHGYLVGEPHKGLSYMFQMMNEARIDVGLSAAAIASAAYYASLEYAMGRLQGRRPGSKDPNLPPVPIIEHADVKRMLLFQRSVVEGSLGLILQCAYYSDMLKVAEGEERSRYSQLLDLLTPMAKSYPSEMSIPSVSTGLQILGGYGFCDEFPLEQYYRDTRIHPIHEGTTAIHGLDILGRKVQINNGKALELIEEEISQTLAQAGADPELSARASELSSVFEELKSVTASLTGACREGNLEQGLADATLYLEMFGITVIAWQWLKQALALRAGLASEPSGRELDFYKGKMTVFNYYYEYELPKTTVLARRLKHSDGLTVNMDSSYFTD